MERLNFTAAWAGIVLGFIAGAVPGLFFYQADWLGGYSSWTRRMIRLAHIAFFGIGFINLAFAATVSAAHLSGPTVRLASILFLCGAALMPTICYLSAWKMGFRQLFFLPVLCLLTAACLVLYGVIR